jgi:hypothetical protein
MNLPNEPGSWDEDFSYAYLGALYARLQRDFRLALFRDAEAVVADGQTRSVLIRHDVDVSLDRALLLARMEASMGVVSTYHVMIDSPFYDVRSEGSVRALREIQRLGHEIGLHYDIVARNMKGADPAARDADIAVACDMLAELAGANVSSLSFHLPVPELLNGDLRVAGRVSGYARDLFRWYLSDSRARWREGEPTKSLEAPRSHVLQILVHPVWWGEANMRPTLRLRELLLELLPRHGGSYDALRARMYDHIIFHAADLATTP